jgi:hypothetical protein
MKKELIPKREKRCSVSDSCRHIRRAGGASVKMNRFNDGLDGMMPISSVFINEGGEKKG